MKYFKQLTSGFSAMAAAAFVATTMGAFSPLLAQGTDPAKPAATATESTPAATRGSGKGHGMMRGSGKKHGMRRGSGKKHGMRRGSGMGHGMHGMHCPMKAAQGLLDKAQAKRAMMEAHLAYKKSALNITAAQSAQWDAYADELRKRRAAKMEMRKAMMAAKKSGTPVERMELRLGNLTTKLEILKALKSATENLYGVLSDSQKKMADAILR